MKDVFNLKTLFPTYNETYLKKYNYIGDRIILSIFTIFSCVVGLVGNGNVIWLLGFRIKRKPLAIFILNLAVADFGSLLFLLPLTIDLIPPTFEKYVDIPLVPTLFLINLFLSMHASSQFLLAAISIDRWVSVMFPNWYQCHRSQVISTTVCVLMWALSLVLNGMVFLLALDMISGDALIAIIVAYGLSILICPLLVILSTLTIFIKICFKSPPCQCGKLLKVTLFILLSFLLSTILNCACVVMLLLEYCVLWTSLKHSINPLTYFLAGRLHGGKFQERMKATLQRVFREERHPKMELQSRTQTLL